MASRNKKHSNDFLDLHNEPFSFWKTDHNKYMYYDNIIYLQCEQYTFKPPGPETDGV